MIDRPANFELVADRSGRQWQITAKVNGVVGFMDVLNPATETQRRKFIECVFSRFPAVPREALETELLKIAAVPEKADDAEAIHETPDPLANTPEDVLAEAEELLTDPELIRHVCDDVAVIGVAGERELALLVYLIGVSRMLAKPLAGIVRGSSTSGKSHVIERVASLFPPEVLIFATQMTPQALFHMPPGSLKHRWVVAGERSRLEDDDRAEATRALREMLSSGRLSKLMPEKVEGGRIETQTIEQEGPIAFIESTTLTTIFEEDANRCLLLSTDECQKQTRRILEEIADRRSSSQSNAPDRIRSVHHAVQRLLPRAEIRIPYAGTIAECFDCSRVEVRRAFPQLLALIEACALLHHRTRGQAEDGAILATETDYQIARHLISKPFALSLGGGVSDSARRFFESIRSTIGDEFTSVDAKKRTPAARSSVHSWLTELQDAGAVEQVEAPRGRKAAKWRLTGQEPALGVSIIPEVEAIFPGLRIRGRNTETVTQ
jgi:hypothetical protein